MLKNNKIFSFIREYEIIIIVLLGLIALILGCLGFDEYLSNNNPNHNFFDALYQSFQLFNLNSGGIIGHKSCYLEIARLLAPAVVIWAGIKAFVIIAKEPLTLLKLNLLYRNHTVICGLGKKAYYLAGKFLEKNIKLIIIEPDEENDYIKQLEQKGAIILIGNAADKDMLIKAKIRYADNLYILTGDDEINIDIGSKAKMILKEFNRKPLKCFIHLYDIKVLQIFKSHNLFIENHQSFEIKIFNTTQQSSKLGLRNYLGKTIYTKNQTNDAPSILIVGFGWQGQSLLLQILPYFHKSNKKFHITIIDTNNSKIEKFFTKYHFVQQFVDCQFLIKDIETLKQQDLFFNIELKPFDEIYVCLGDDKLAFSVSSMLRDYTNDISIPIVVFMTQATEIGDVINSFISTNHANNSKKPTTDYFSEKNIFFMYIIEETCNYLTNKETTIEDMAQKIHINYLENENDNLINFEKELNDLKANNADESEINKKINDINKIKNNPNRVQWSDLAEGFKDSNRNQAMDNFLKLCILGYQFEQDKIKSKDIVFTVDQIEYLAHIEHRRWMIEKFVDGWKDGDSKDPIKKLHPDLKNWKDLKDVVKQKDIDAINAIPKLFQN